MSRFVDDSPLEGDGFEPSVPRQIFFGRPSIPAQFTFRNINRLPRDRDRWFESISLLQRVINEPGRANWAINSPVAEEDCSEAALGKEAFNQLVFENAASLSAHRKLRKPTASRSTSRNVPPRSGQGNGAKSDVRYHRHPYQGSGQLPPSKKLWTISERAI